MVALARTHVSTPLKYTPHYVCVNSVIYMRYAIHLWLHIYASDNDLKYNEARQRSKNSTNLYNSLVSLRKHSHAHNSVLQSINWEWFHFDFKREKNAIFILFLFLSCLLSANKSGAGAGADVDAGNGTIKIGYLFYLTKIKDKKMGKIPILTRNSFFRFICLVWCWHSDLELCVVIFFPLCLSFVCVFFSAVGFVFGIPIMTVCFYKVGKKVWFCVNVCAIVSKRSTHTHCMYNAGTRKSKWKTYRRFFCFCFQPVFNFQSARFF